MCKLYLYKKNGRKNHPSEVGLSLNTFHQQIFILNLTCTLKSHSVVDRQNRL